MAQHASCCTETTAVEIGLRRWDREFLHRLDALAKRVGQPVTQLVLRANDHVPQGRVLAYFEPRHAGRVVLAARTSDLEAVESRLRASDCTLVDVEPVPNARPLDAFS